MSITSAKLKEFPDAPGVYFFLGKPVDKSPQGQALRLVIHPVPEQARYGAGSREVLYIGKAGSLRDRVRSYFSRDIAETRGTGIKRMVEMAEDIAYEKTDSVLEAVLLEAELIKKYQPKYNVREKDDKSFNYVAITKEDFPRVILIRGKELVALRNNSKLTAEDYGLKTVFGPFPHGGTLREALSIIRKIFPYRDKCTPLRHANILQNVSMSLLSDRKRSRQRGILRRSASILRYSAPKPCFGRQIGLCPGVCTDEISKKEYAKTIRNITLLFRGKKITLLRTLAHDMKTAAKTREFEQAAKIRNTIFALKHIQDISLIKRDRALFELEPNFESNYIYERSSVYKVQRIEAYDVAHTSGKEIVGVMTTLYGGEPDKSAYRKFKLRAVSSSNDTAALKEVLERRLTHAEWPFPELIVVDGGKAQVNVATRVLKESGLETPVVGVVKDEHHHPKNVLGDVELRKKYENEILLANSEVHRFAISFHRERMRKRK
ncbi:MAG: UvrB/UvrC motif-containing protein [Parcubacteria group bacterium]|nr:UvrB/UvrC motif-containing protein [Parcubacteria group bacterium]